MLHRAWQSLSADCRTVQRTVAKINKLKRNAVTDDKNHKKVVPLPMKAADEYCSCRPSADVKVARG